MFRSSEGKPWMTSDILTFMKPFCDLLSSEYRDIINMEYGNIIKEQCWKHLAL